MGETVFEGTVARWLIAEGQPVQQDEPLLTITTDKIDTEIPAPASGILLRIHVAEGETVLRGTVLAEIGEADEGLRTKDQSGLSSVSSPPSAVSDQRLAVNSQPSATPLAQQLAADRGIDLSAITGTGPGGRITREDVEASAAASLIPSSTVHRPSSSLGFLSPAVSRLAAELDVDLTQVIGTGLNGRITKKDVLAYVAAPVPRGLARSETDQSAIAPGIRATEAAATVTPARSETGQSAVDEPAAPPTAETAGDIMPLSAMRRSIGQHMFLSLQTAPQVTTVMEADMTRVVLARERLRADLERQGVRLTFTPFFIQAIVAGLRAVPEANSTLRDDGLLIHTHIHVGVAVALTDGLIVPVLRDADEKSLLGLARAVNDVAERARRGQLQPHEVQGGTFTLTNHGTSGSLFATPILVQPQTGILGVGAIRKRPVVISRGHALLPDAEDAIAIRPMAFLSFTFDHRVLDGQSADRFLETVVRFLENDSG
jgi:2-oxoglutarate dehydrogenase E2 component (dihydrolipoamide succinyltransferase)